MSWALLWQVPFVAFCIAMVLWIAVIGVLALAALGVAYIGGAWAAIRFLWERRHT